MIYYKYNEEEYAKQIEKNGFLSTYHVYELTLLVKLWKSQGIKPKERKERLYDFCRKYIENFNDVKYFRKINSALRNGNKKDNPLVVIKKIPITNSEIDFINKLDIESYLKKVLFTLLVSMKIKKGICRIKYGNIIEGNYISGNQKRYNDLFETSKIPNKYKINNIINELERLGFIDVRTKGRINLLFIELIPESDKIVFHIDTFDNLGYYFDWYNGDQKIIRCEKCGKLIRQNTHNKKYCKKCAKSIQQEQKNKWKQDNWKKCD